MSHRNILILSPSFRLYLLIVLAVSSFVVVTANEPIKTDSLLESYLRTGTTYLNECEDLTEKPNPSDEQLSSCLKLAKEARDQFNPVVQRLEAIRDEAKRAKQWTIELDNRFYQEAEKQNKSEFAADVKAAGGFRLYFDKTHNEVKNSKADFDIAVKNLEDKISKRASANFQIFQKNSFKGESIKEDKLPAKKVHKAIRKLLNHIRIACFGLFGK